MTKLIKVLLVEDSEAHRELIVRELRKGGYTVESQVVKTSMQMSHALVGKDWDIIISDYHMSNFNGHDAVKLFKRSGLDCPFIIVSEAALDESGGALMAAGVDDYLTKENLGRLIPVVDRELEHADVRRQWKKLNEKLQHIGSHDATTGLPNHLVLHEKIVYAIASANRNGNQVALLVMKISRFRLMNEALGDPLFDLLLIQLARRLREILDPSLTLACLRSNEFGVLVPVTSGSDHAVQILRSIAQALELPFILGDGLKVEIQPSFGIALFPQHATAPDLLLKRARAALGTAVTNHRQYSFYSGEQYESTHNKLALVTDLRRAIIENELFVIYQLRVDLPKLQVTGAEALLRWKHPSLGILNADQFTALAERSGLIMPITLWLINEALRQCRVWNQQHSRQLTVAVNLSPWNLQSSVLPEQIKGLIVSSGVLAPQLELEITENALMTSPKEAEQILTAIKEIGLKLSVGNFGTGYSSLAHLHRLPIDAIKIDKSFVRKLVTQSRDAVIVRSTIQLAHNLGLKVVAEGVEDRETLRILVTMGCDMAQGYYISHPRPAEELLGAGSMSGSLIQGKEIDIVPGIV